MQGENTELEMLPIFSSHAFLPRFWSFEQRGLGFNVQSLVRIFHSLFFIFPIFVGVVGPAFCSFSPPLHMHINKTSQRAKMDVMVYQNFNGVLAIQKSIGIYELIF